MLRLYFAQALDCSPDKGRAQLARFKEILSKFSIELHGAGIGESPIIKLDSSLEVKKAIVAHDRKEIAECDIFLVVSDLKTFCPGTCMELEFARMLGKLTIFLALSNEKVKNIFLETEVNRIVYSISELEKVLKEITEVEDED